jgi:hypothetical protein
MQCARVFASSCLAACALVAGGCSGNDPGAASRTATRALPAPYRGVVATKRAKLLRSRAGSCGRGAIAARVRGLGPFELAQTATHGYARVFLDADWCTVQGQVTGVLHAAPRVSAGRLAFEPSRAWHVQVAHGRRLRHTWTIGGDASCGLSPCVIAYTVVLTARSATVTFRVIDVT